MVDWFLHIKEIEEDDGLKNSLWSNDEVENYVNYLTAIKSSAIVWLIGSFWSGKSVFLNQVKERLNTKEWMLFDAWEYSSRKDLWDGFVLKLLEHFGLEKNEIDQLKQEIDGKWYFFKSDTIRKLIAFGTFLSLVCYFTLADKDFPVLAISIFALITSLFALYQKPAITRTNEYREILSAFIEKYQENRIIYIVLEDIDRAWEEGRFFIETVKGFINTVLKENKHIQLVFILPIQDEELEEHFNSYVKCLNSYTFHKPDIAWGQFIDKVFVEETIEETTKNNIMRIFNELSKKHSIRELKFILRRINFSYIRLKEKYPSLNWQFYLFTQLYISIRQKPKKSERNEFYKIMGDTQQNASSFTIPLIPGQIIMGDYPWQALYAIWEALFASSWVIPNDSYITKKTIDFTSDDEFHLDTTNPSLPFLHLPKYYLDA